MHKYLLNNLKPSSFISGRLLLIRRIMMITVANLFFSGILIIFGITSAIKLLVGLSANPVAITIVLLYLISHLIFLIGVKPRITKISVITACISLWQYLFLLFLPTWQMHAGSEFSFIILLIMRILAPILLIGILIIYFFYWRVLQKYKNRLNIKQSSISDSF